MYGPLLDRSTIRNNLRYGKIVINASEEKKSICDEDYAKNKREEIKQISFKYNIDESQSQSLLIFYLKNRNLKNGTLMKTVDFISQILKRMYDYTDEEVSVFLNKNAQIMKASYGNFVTRLSIFNHIGLLKEVIFKGNYFLSHDFDNDYYGTYSLYAIITENNIISLEELREVIARIPDREVNNLRKKYPLTEKIKQELKSELKRTIKREERHREFEKRLSKRM